MADFTFPPIRKSPPETIIRRRAAHPMFAFFQIYRWSPDDDANPRVDRFEVDLDECGPMVSTR